MLTLFLSPIVLLFGGLLALSVFALWRRDKAIFLASGVLAAVFYVSSAPLVANVLARAVALPAAPQCTQPVQDATVVVLTGGASGSARSVRELWRLDQSSFRRIVHAVEIAMRSSGSELLVSGGAEVGLTNEAQIAGQLVLQLGWPAKRLRIEDTSIDTYTSARDVAPMLQAGRPLLLVTSDLHMRRAAYIYRKAGMKPLTCGVPDPDALIFPDSLIPSAGALAKFSQIWKEVLGLVVYSFRDPPVHVAD